MFAVDDGRHNELAAGTRHRHEERTRFVVEHCAASLSNVAIPTRALNSPGGAMRERLRESLRTQHRIAQAQVWPHALVESRDLLKELS